MRLLGQLEPILEIAALLFLSLLFVFVLASSLYARIRELIELYFWNARVRKNRKRHLDLCRAEWWDGDDEFIIAQEMLIRDRAAIREGTLKLERYPDVWDYKFVRSPLELQIARGRREARARDIAALAKSRTLQA